MSNMIILDPLDVSAVTVSSGTGADNLKTPSPREVWVAGAAGNATITIDLGAVYAVDTAVLCFTNLAAGDTVTTETAQAANFSDAAPLDARQVVDSYNITHVLLTGALRNARHVRFSIATGATPRVGVVCIGAKFQPTWNREWGGGRQIIDTGSKEALLNGDFGIGEGVRKSGFRWTFGDLTGDETEILYNLGLNRGETRTVVVVEDPDNTAGLIGRIHYGLFDRFEEYSRQNVNLTRWSLSVTGWGAAPRRGAIVVPWTPKLLFEDGRPGYWGDPSDLSTLFQDTAGTIPVTAAGQSVARMNDKSGRGNHAMQADAARRPTLQQDVAGKYYLSYDGVDDGLTIGAIALVAGMSLYMALMPNVGAVRWVSAWGDFGAELVGVAESGSGGTAHGGAGAPTHWVDRVQVAGFATTRAQLHAAMGSGATRLLEVRGADLSGWAALNLHGYTPAAGYVIGGRDYGTILLPDLSADDGMKVADYLKLKAGGAW